MADIAGSYLSGVRMGDSLTKDLISGGVEEFQGARRYRDVLAAKVSEIAAQKEQLAYERTKDTPLTADQLDTVKKTGVLTGPGVTKSQQLSTLASQEKIEAAAAKATADARRGHTVATGALLKNNPKLAAMGFQEGDLIADRFVSEQTKPTAPGVSMKEQKDWEAFAKDADVSQASSRSLLGISGQLNARADRALETLKSKTMTGQQLAGVTSDIAGILKGGTPDEQSEKMQNYGTAYTTLQNHIQYWRGKPQEAVPEEIKAKLRETIADLKKVDNRVITNHRDALRAKYAPLLKADAKRADTILGGLTRTTKTADEEGARPSSGDPVADLLQGHL